MEKLSLYLDRYASLPGWFTEESAAVWDVLLAFQRNQKIVGTALEIGVYHGKSAALACMHLQKDEKLVLVDPYRLETVRSLLENLKEENVLLYPCISTRLPEPDMAALSGQCRWIHIDGEHTGFACSHDLALADRLLDDRGVVVIDDFLSPKYPQVSAAVFAYLLTHPFSFRMFLCGFQKAYLVRPRFTSLYLNFVRESLQDELRNRNFGSKISLFKTTMPDDYNCFGMGRYEGVDVIGLDWDKSCVLV
jgi:hypothetical protein